MWTCRRTAFAFIRLCSVCSVNRRTLSIWCRYFKEKYIRNHTDVDIHSFEQPTNNQRNTCPFACAANAEQAQLFSICSHLSRSPMPCLRLHTDMDAPWKSGLCAHFWRIQRVLSTVARTAFSHRTFCINTRTDHPQVLKECLRMQTNHSNRQSNQPTEFVDT